MIQAFKVESTWQQINDAFDVCDNSTIGNNATRFDALFNTITDALGTMAMVNYPYETNFLRPLPAWPVQASCVAAAGVREEEVKDSRNYDYQNIQRLAAMMKVWQGEGNCVNLVGSNETDPLDG